jgi:DNA replication initiation complex subunit (GINS family)
MHTTGSSNIEALQATKVLAHDEQTIEKHALLNAHTKAWPRVQEEVVQNRQRNVVTQAWGKIPENTTPLSLRQNVSINRVVFAREVTGRCHAFLDAWFITFATKAQTNAKRDAHHEPCTMRLLSTGDDSLYFVAPFQRGY